MRWPLVVDVPVLFSDKFLQSKESDLIVPQFIFRVRDIPVQQRRVRTVQPVQKTGDSPGAVLGEDVDAPVVAQRQGYGPDSAENRVGAAPAVHRRGVEPL